MKNRQPGSKNSTKPSSKRMKPDDATTTSKSTWEPAKAKKASRRQDNLDFAKQTSEMQRLQTSYINHQTGHREATRSFIAETARWVLSNRNNPKVIKWLMSHGFWGNRKPPKNVMQAAMAFMAGRHSKLAQKRQRIVDFLLSEGCEPENLEEALKEGIETIYARATQADPKHKKKQPRKVKENGGETSKTKDRPVYLTGEATKILKGLFEGDRIRVTLEIEDVNKRILKIVKAVPLQK